MTQRVGVHVGRWGRSDPDWRTLTADSVGAPSGRARLSFSR